MSWHQRHSTLYQLIQFEGHRAISGGTYRCGPTRSPHSATSGRPTLRPTIRLQTAALAFGKTADEVRAEGTAERSNVPACVCRQQPTTSILAPGADARGSLESSSPSYEQYHPFT